MKYDVCIIGSGAGAGPIAYELALAGKKVVVLEKGPWIKTDQFTKDEIVAARRDVYTSNLKDEPQVIEKLNKEGKWVKKSTYTTGISYWSGNCVGGASNFMSGYFHRLKPNDFKLLSKYGEIEGANIVDWPIDYEEMEAYYDKVEKIVGVSGKVINHKFQEPRSTANFPQPPLAENIISKWLDKGAKELSMELIPMPRSILSRPKEGRGSCVYSNYCGSYGCATDAKGSSRAALLNQAVESGNCDIKDRSKVFKLETDGNFNVVKAKYYNPDDNIEEIEADLFVVAAQAIETSRILLMSKNKEFPNGLANNAGNVGKNLVFSAGGTGSGQFFFKDFDNETSEKLNMPGVFVNRSMHSFYEIDDHKEFNRPIKGGIIDFLWQHANPIPKAIKAKWDGSELVYGSKLKQKIKSVFTEQRTLDFEVFIDWLPNDNCFIELDSDVKDKWGDPVAKIRVGNHPHDLKVGRYVVEKARKLLKQIGAKNVRGGVSSAPPPNLVAGGCRFGDNPNTSVLDKNCKAHEVNNLYITDGSFMPTAGSVTQTWTIYANSFRVADVILKS